MHNWIMTTSQSMVIVFSLVGFGSPACAAGVEVGEKEGTVTIANMRVKVDFDLRRGTYRATDLRDNSVCICDARFQLDALTSTDPDIQYTWQGTVVKDELGEGKTLALVGKNEGRPDLLLEITLYRGEGFIVLGCGIDNGTDQPVQLRQIRPLIRARAFKGFKLDENFSMLDGHGGGEPTAVTHNSHLDSRNNLLVTFGVPGKNRSLVLGGLTYHDFEKFAMARGVDVGVRRSLLAKRGADTNPLRCYLNLGGDGDLGEDDDAPTLRLLQGSPSSLGYAQPRNHFELSSIVFDYKQIVLEATDLDPEKSYQLGFSWWDYNKDDRVMSVLMDEGPGTKQIVLLEKQVLPIWFEKRELAEEVLIAIPSEAYCSGRARIVFRLDSGVNAVLSEAWLREGPGHHLIDQAGPRRRQVDPPTSAAASALEVRLSAADPVGKRVDPGVRYLPDDRFYVDFTCDDPFEALEQYGRSVRAAQKIQLSMYDFPTVCLWYSQGDCGEDGSVTNDSTGAVREMDVIVASGWMKYARAAVRLVPDCYDANNQQGWWDDAHWQMHGSGARRQMANVEGGHYNLPYETSEKWGKAVSQRGGIPLTYFQTGVLSQDYTRAFPGHMLSNRSGLSYDFTDPEFLKHMHEVYANLRSGGIKGLMFDYAGTGWAGRGGFEDAYSTTAAAYRTVFRLPHQGLGPNSYVHERNLSRGSDITLGLVASQRTWSDSDQIHPMMVTWAGLRWYKNRVVVNYDLDGKNLVVDREFTGFDNRNLAIEKPHPRSRASARNLLTLAYTVSGRLLLANSFSRMSKQGLHDLSRLYPFHTTPKTARPVDALINRFPTVYDFEVNPGWHQVTFYNTACDSDQWHAPDLYGRVYPKGKPIPAKVGVDLAGHRAFGGLGLDRDKPYYVYDFWNDSLVGTYEGSQRLEFDMGPSEARMLSIREVLDRPQFISTNRHIMQGYVDMVFCRWDQEKTTLAGRCKVIAGEPYKVVIATNGWKPGAVATEDATCSLQVLPGKDRLVALIITSSENREVDWRVGFSR